MPDYCISPSGHPRTLSRMLPFWGGVFQCQLPLYPWLGGKCQAWGACILIMWWNKVPLLDMFTNTLLPQEAGVSKSSHLAKNWAILELKPYSQRPVGTILILAHSAKMPFFGIKWHTYFFRCPKLCFISRIAHRLSTDSWYFFCIY